MKRVLRFAAAAAVVLALLPVPARGAELLIPGGEIVGLHLQSQSVTVAAYDDALGAAAREAGVRIGDELVEINGQKVTCARDVPGLLQQGSGEVALTLRRGSRMSRVHLNPVQTQEGRRLGVYLRQGIAGIGTVTFYQPESGLFGTLGHGVNDARGTMLHLTRGSAFEAGIETVKKGKSGDPGQLHGCADGDRQWGVLTKNTPQGVFGFSCRGCAGQPVFTAAYESIQTGAAVIRSAVEGGTVREYCVEILKIYPKTRPDGRNFLLKVTDPALLEATGGIVQGMSGSPILQDGKLVGAVTHVLVSDPTVGYGIFIENMLDAAA